MKPAKRGQCYIQQMTKRYEWDWPPEPEKKRSRRPRIERIEVLPPRQPDGPIQLNIDVRRPSSVSPQHVIIGAALLFVALILFRSPMVLLVGAVLISGWLWLAFGFIVAVLLVASISNASSGKPF